MAMVRAFGLIFFLTLLVGGCIMANNSSPRIDLAAEEATEISWDAAVDFARSGKVASITPGDGMVVMVLLDGSVVAVALPIEEMLEEELIRCGHLCNHLQELRS